MQFISSSDQQFLSNVQYNTYCFNNGLIPLLDKIVYVMSGLQLSTKVCNIVLENNDKKIHPRTIKLERGSGRGSFLCATNEYARWFYSRTYNEVNADIVLVSEDYYITFRDPELEQCGYYYCYGHNAENHSFISAAKLKVYGKLCTSPSLAILL